MKNLRARYFFAPEPLTAWGINPLYMVKYQLYQILMCDTWLESSRKPKKYLHKNACPQIKIYPPNGDKEGIYPPNMDFSTS